MIEGAVTAAATFAVLFAVVALVCAGIVAGQRALARRARLALWARSEEVAALERAEALDRRVPLSSVSTVPDEDLDPAGREMSLRRRERLAALPGDERAYYRLLESLGMQVTRPENFVRHIHGGEV